MLTLVSVWSAVVLAQLPAPASCPATAASRARAQFATLDFAESLATTGGVEQCQDGSPDEVAEALLWRAQALAALGRDAAAVDAFTRLELLSPGYALDPLLSPKIHDLHRRGRVRVSLELPVFARVLAPVVTAEGFRIKIEVFDPGSRPVVVRVRLKGASAVAATRVGALYEGMVPLGAAGSKYEVEVRQGDQVLFLAPPQVVPQRLPADAPLELVLRPPRAAPTPVATSAVETHAGVIIGGAAIAAVVIAVVSIAVVATRPRPFCGSLGCVNIP